jgi:hypothetical protein
MFRDITIRLAGERVSKSEKPLPLLNPESTKGGALSVQGAEY